MGQLERWGVARSEWCCTVARWLAPPEPSPHISAFSTSRSRPLSPALLQDLGGAGSRSAAQQQLSSLLSAAVASTLAGPAPAPAPAADEPSSSVRPSLAQTAAALMGSRSLKHRPLEAPHIALRCLSLWSQDLATLRAMDQATHVRW